MRLWIKLAAAGLVLLAGVLGVVYQATSQLLAGAVTRQLQTRGTELAGPLSAALIAPLVLKDFATVQAVIDSATETGHLRSLRLTDMRGRVVAYSGGLVVQNEPLLGMPYRDSHGQLWMNFHTPLTAAGQPLGELRYALSAEALSDNLAELRRHLFKISALTVLVFGALVVLGSHRLTAPLRRLTAAARQMQLGHYEVALAPGGRDEIGQLSTSLAALRDAIRERIGQLGLARDAAESANRAKSAFLANTSHELRTPLNGLLGMARLAQQPELDPERRSAYLDLVVDSAQSLADILSDTLDLARIEAGKLVLTPQAFEPRQLLQRVVSAYRLLADGAGLQLTLCVADAVPEVVLGDALRVRQIASNFLANALKFTEQGRITVRLRREQDDRLRLSVQDTGLGISPALAARLFTPFTQADDSSTRRHGGTGLGLAICRELAQRMGGEVGVNSQPGLGSEFWALLQLPACAAPQVSPVSVPAAAEVAVLHGARVLLVEDNPVNRVLACALLERWGMQVTEAHDGQQAITAVQQAEDAGTPFAVVLMDVQMPVMDGHAATRALRTRHSASALPIIALTAAALLSERDSALAAGMNDFLTKPLDANNLRAVLCRHLGAAAAEPLAPLAPPATTELTPG